MRTLRTIRYLLLALVILAIPATSFAQFGVSITVAPPALFRSSQPICPQEGYLWTPGYWAYGPEGYFWVPGTWVEPPAVGLLWTPGYWGWGGGVYLWHTGYWGPQVGFYGGINYGFGYTGVGFAGGYWRGGAFYYNRAVANVNVAVIHNSYHTEVVEHGEVSRASFNGGAGGVAARPTAEERDAEHERHTAATSSQMEHEHMASTNREMLASANHGRPSVAATSRPGEFHGSGAVPARAENEHEAGTRPTNEKRAEKPAKQQKGKQSHEGKSKPEKAEKSKDKPKD